MLSRSDTSVEEVLNAFAQYGQDTAFIVPTENGLSHAILDATQDVRSFLHRNGIHDFQSQSQGIENKVSVEIGLVSRESVEWREMSLYRPNTKSGDPRVWISMLNNFAKPWNLLTLVVGGDNRLYVVNASDGLLINSLNETESATTGPYAHFKRVLAEAVESPIALELRTKLELIARSGPVTSLRSGSTGIGYTLETLLGIKANSSKTPDFKGIEIKSGRARKVGKSKNRVNLFSQVPNWSISPVKSGTELLNKYGYFNANTSRKELYCTVGPKPNPQGLFFDSPENGDYLLNLFSNESISRQKVVEWSWSTLEKALEAKHKETFWIQAKSSTDSEGAERFLFSSVTHTKKPLLGNFRTLISLGKITMDYTLSQKESGAARDHGYLFKIHPDNLSLLFPSPRQFSLLD